MKWIKTLTLLAALIIFFLFAALAVKQPVVSLNFAAWQTPYELSVFWWLLIAFCIGLIFGLFNTLWVNFNLRMTNRKLRQELNKKSDEAVKTPTQA